MGELAPGQSFGRYTIVEELGSGGMGVVYAAHDAELDRRVALKILRPGAVAEGSKAGEYTVRLDQAGNERDLVRERLLAEARALARLSHPNLVAVYEVGAVGDQVFLAMEHIAGVSLSEWLRAARPWREVLAAFVQAGRGLEAAHAGGLVHGDFKPDNAVVESTGRVRVVDFGLARAAGTRSAAGVVGTPRYMAPEQRANRKVDARADQVAFAIALHEALGGDRRAPRAVERAIRRGMARDPADRFPSMAEFLAELEPRSVVRRRSLVAAAAAAIAAGAVFFAFGGAGDETCTGGPARLAGVWDADTRARLAGAFAATGRPHAGASSTRIAQELDEYAGAWKKMYRGACLDSARGEQSPELLDRRMACLDRRVDQLRLRTALLTEKPDGEVVDRALDLVAEVEPLDPCADAEALLGATAPPADPGRRASAAAIERIVDRAELERAGGRVGAALSGAREGLERARALGHAPLHARAAHIFGVAVEDAGRHAEAEEALHEALKAAERAGDDVLAARVLIRLVHMVGSRQSRFSEGRTLARLADAALARAGERADRDLRAQLLGNLGSVALAQGELAEAVSLFQQSLSIRRKRFAPDDRRLAAPEDRLATALMRQARYREAEAHFRTALAIRRRTLGDDHLHTSAIHLNLGTSYLQEGRLDEARAQFQRALTISERVPEYSKARVHNNLGILEHSAGNHAEAIRHHQAALAERRERLGPSHPEVATSLRNLGSALLDSGQLDRALELLEQAVVLRRRTVGESHPLYASALHGLGDALQRTGRAREALAHHDRAVAVLRERSGPDHPGTAEARGLRAVALVDLGRSREALAELEHALARVPESEPTHPQLRFGLARALWSTRGDRQRAVDLAHSARAALAAAKRDAADVDAWLARHARGRRPSARAGLWSRVPKRD